MYRIASISKLITSLGVMRMVEAGELDLDADVSHALGFACRNPHFPKLPISLRMLMSHTSSLRDDAGYYWESQRNVRLQDVLTPGGVHHGSGAMWSSQHAPGSYFSYNNLAWGVIGTLMERVSGQRFDRLMKERVLQPLGLRGGFHPADFSDAELSDTATLYRKRTEFGGREVWSAQGPWVAQADDYVKQRPLARAGADYVPGNNGTLMGPQGNCRLSAQDLGQVMLMLIQHGQHGGRAFLQTGTVQELLKVQWRLDALQTNGDVTQGSHPLQFTAWGLGNQHFADYSGPGRGDRLVAAGGYLAKGHLGDAWGLTAAFVFDPRARNGMIYLIGGVGFNPESYPGQYSAFYRHEELILDALHRHVLADGV
jgi:CubicO group peptidase (beta-lactamase class C family)